MITFICKCMTQFYREYINTVCEEIHLQYHTFLQYTFTMITYNNKIVIMKVRISFNEKMHS